MSRINIRDSRTDRPSHLQYNTHVSGTDPMYIEFQHRYGPRKIRDRSVLINYQAFVALLALREGELNFESGVSNTLLVDWVRRVVYEMASDVAKESVKGKATLEATLASIQNVVNSYKSDKTIEAIVARLLPGLLPPAPETDYEIVKGDSFGAREESIESKTIVDSYETTFEHIADVLAGEKYFDPMDLRDERDRVHREIVQRRGQPDFRKKLIMAYEGCCAVIDCDAIEALEAAHIVPYTGTESNDVTNGLLLRADIHTLFDMNLLRVDPKSLEVVLAPSLKTSTYSEYTGRRIIEPENPDDKPNRQALQHRWES